MRAEGWIAIQLTLPFVLGACALEARPLDPAADASERRALHAPLPPPDPAVGVQLRMPPHGVGADTEQEVCFASYFDLTDAVPPAFQTPDGRAFYVSGTEIVQDGGSHHVSVLHSALEPARLDDRGFGAWTCKGGSHPGSQCDPRVPGACGAHAVCGSEPRPSRSCIGYGPEGLGFVDTARTGIGTALQPHLVLTPLAGVFRKVPLRGVLYWALHTSNRSAEVRVQRAAMNLTFASYRRIEESHLSIPGRGHVGLAPFQEREVCASWLPPAGARLIRLSSHTHRRGRRFRVFDPSGAQIYESLDYANPLQKVVEPQLVLDASAPAARTLRFCALFNNGVGANGAPDLALVTRRSRTPDYALHKCTPVACTAGRVTAPCAEHVDCDSAPGRGDGECDACPITAGETTEHEMFFLLPVLATEVAR